MPGYKGHLVGGCCAYSVVLGAMYILGNSFRPSFSTLILWLMISLAGALFPDIDTKSKGQKYFYWILFWFLMWRILQFKKIPSDDCFNIVALTAIVALIPLLVPHRGITHQEWFVTGIAGIAWIVLCRVFPCHASVIPLQLTFFVVGAWSHIWLDRYWSGKQRMPISKRFAPKRWR
jgi:LexA-binding, inner membrane-associated putative hydrolase